MVTEVMTFVWRLISDLVAYICQILTLINSHREVGDVVFDPKILRR